MAIQHVTDEAGFEEPIFVTAIELMFHILIGFREIKQ
jgi:hypothetical protein